MAYDQREQELIQMVERNASALSTLQLRYEECVGENKKVGLTRVPCTPHASHHIPQLSDELAKAYETDILGATPPHEHKGTGAGKDPSSVLTEGLSHAHEQTAMLDRENELLGQQVGVLEHELAEAR